MFRTFDTLRDLETSVRSSTEKVILSISNEMEAARIRSEDQAHLATRGDRPFVGCTPSAPPDLTCGPEPGINPPARVRNGDGKA
jgi:hypothetical protein